MLGQLLTDVEALYALVRKGDAVNVNDQSTKDRIITLATRYFSQVRPQLTKAMGETELIVSHDQHWQSLIRLAHGNNARNTYVRTIGQIRKELTEFNVSILVAAPIRREVDGTNVELSREEALLLQTLEILVPSAAASYRQGMFDLNNPNRISYRGTAAEFRESLRETLDYLASDENVIQQAGFALEPGQNRPTMRQKVKFVLTSRRRNKTQRQSAEKSLALIDELSGEVMRAVYNRASLATHVQESKRELYQIKRYVDTVFFDLLEITI